MKNKIKKISKGNFQVERPDIEFETTNIVLIIGEGEVTKGSFTLRNRLDGDIRGLVYASSFRVHLAEQGFDGNPVKVEFTYDGKGLRPGQVEKSKFTVVCNGGEYELSFTAIVGRPYIMTSYGKVQSIKDFKKLAMLDFSIAKRLFRSRDFYEVIKYEDSMIVNLYDNMRKWALNEESLEEFLVGIKQKECLFLMLSGEEIEYKNLTEARKGVLSITKNTWGYMPIKVETDGDFLRVIRNRFTTDEFIGNGFELEYFIDADKLHLGRNFGEIILQTPYENLHYSVIVTQECKKSGDETERGLIEAGLIKGYLSLISGKMDVNAWTARSVKVIKELRNRYPDEEWYELIHANICLRGNQPEEARWILENYNNKGKFGIVKKTEQHAYYLFLTALLKQDSGYSRQISEELNKMFLKNPSSWQLLCMLINIDTEYRNYSERLYKLERLYFMGTNSLLFFSEAYLCYQEKPTTLKKLGKFELRVLSFATKYNMITRELALYAANLASQHKVYNEELYRILEKCYKLYPDQMIVNAICTLLIKGNRVGQEYFKWYELAVKSEVKMAQLFENYMLSIGPAHIRHPLPRTIFLYFMHGNNLNYQKEAALYANLIVHEDEDSNLYIQYRKNIEKFAWEQLELRHINDDLAIIYKRFCNEIDMTPERILALRDICCAYNVKTNVPDMKCVHIIEADGSIHQTVPYTEQGAQVYLYDKKSRIVWEKKDGRHYTGSIPFETKRLFYELRFIDMYKKKMETYGNSSSGRNKVPLSFDVLREKGIDAFEEQQVFGLCNKKIREDNYEEDDFLTYVCFEMFKRGQYNKITLSYLANYYCGATNDMKLLWREANDYGIQTNKLAERIITQMLFSEVLFGEEDIFRNYYESGAYFRLKQAYLAYVSRQYVVSARQVKSCIFEIILKEYQEEEEMADICKVAALKYYAGKTFSEEVGEILRVFLQEMCEKQLVFPYYLQYPEAWLREVQLYDKVMVEYRSEKGGRVKFCYQLMKNGEEQTRYEEALTAVYENIYVKEIVLFHDEQLRYYFKETLDDTTITSEKMTCVQQKRMSSEGKYGRLDVLRGMSGTKQCEAIEEYQVEEALAKDIFEVF